MGPALLSGRPGMSEDLRPGFPPRGRAIAAASELLARWTTPLVGTLALHRWIRRWSRWRGEPVTEAALRPDGPMETDRLWLVSTLMAAVEAEVSACAVNAHPGALDASSARMERPARSVAPLDEVGVARAAT